MAILRTGNITRSSLMRESPYGVYHFGKPDENAIVYLYVFPKDKFEQTQNPNQYISRVPIKPLRIFKLKVKDYLHLVRDATEEEKQKFEQKLKYCK
jgi:hypothetical protein